MAEHNDFMLKSKTEGIRLDYAHSCGDINTGKIPAISDFIGSEF